MDDEGRGEVGEGEKGGCEGERKEVGMRQVREGDAGG